VGTNGGRGGRNRALGFAADAGDAIADVLLHYADPDDSHPSLKIYVKNLIIAPPYGQKKAVERLA
jgi:hypothetical protein